LTTPLGQREQRTQHSTPIAQLISDEARHNLAAFLLGTVSATLDLLGLE
jgi:hypothetical protein